MEQYGGRYAHPLSAELRARARVALKDKFGVAILVMLVASLLGDSGIVPSIGIKFSQPVSGAADYTYNIGAFAGRGVLRMEDPLLAAIIGGAAVFMAILTALSLISLIFSGPVMLGRCNYFTKLALNERSDFSDLFSRFDIFGKGFGLRLFMALFVFLWSLLLVIPGIVAAYSYAMAPYLMARDPSLGIREAVDMSKQLMNGNKSRLFCLHLSFIGWALLAVLTMGIGFIVLEPYIKASEAEFFVELARISPNGAQGGGAGFYDQSNQGWQDDVYSGDGYRPSRNQL